MSTVYTCGPDSGRSENLQTPGRALLYIIRAKSVNQILFASMHTSYALVLHLSLPGTFKRAYRTTKFEVCSIDTDLPDPRSLLELHSGTEVRGLKVDHCKAMPDAPLRHPGICANILLFNGVYGHCACGRSFDIHAIPSKASLFRGLNLRAGGTTES